MPTPLTPLADWFRRSHQSQHSLAERLGVSDATISRYVSGERQPSLRVAVQLAQATGLPVSAFLSSPDQQSA